jgi:chitinase
MGDSGTSAPVAITVYPPPPPEVKIVNPENGETFYTPNGLANVYITAITEHFTNRIASIEFLSGTNVLTTRTNSPWPLSFDWKNVPVGSYSLTAVATDTASNTATSSPVDITVSTNRPGWQWNTGWNRY